MPASNAIGSVNACSAPPRPIGETNTNANSIAAASAFTPPIADCRATRCASTMYAVKSPALANANARPSRLAAELHVGEQIDTERSDDDRADVACDSCADERERVGPMNSIAATVASGSRSIET